THTRPAQRGPSKPAVQIQCIPTYGEKLHHSPTEELACHGLGAATNGSTQGSEIRGRIDVLTTPSTAQPSPNLIQQAGRRSFVDSSTQTVDSESQLKEATTRPPPRTRSYTRKIHTAPCFSTPDYILPPREPEDVLLGSLRGFQLRPVGSAQSTSVHVLAVGLSWSHVEGKALPGPAHDICWLEKFFADQQQVRFNSLLDREASFSKIQQSVAHIYMNAQPNDYAILYFTGHGDSRNAFELYDGPGSLDEVTLNGWIVELRQKSSKQVPVYIIFDFCRESSVRSDAQLDRDVTVVWSCPPGQKSPDLGLSNDLPYSCFLLALLLAIYDGSECHASSTVQYFARRLTELLNVIWGIRCYGPDSWRRKRWCRHAHSCELCRDEKHGSHNGGEWPDPQLFEVLNNMYLGKLPDFPTVVRYASTRLPLPIRKVRQLLGGNQWFMYFNPSLISTDKGSSTLKERKFLPRDVHTTSESAMHARGTTMPLGAMPAAPSK
ncbi:unnamed protein product, partial [Rhizoctonia solani]